MSPSYGERSRALDEATASESRGIISVLVAWGTVDICFRMRGVENSASRPFSRELKAAVPVGDGRRSPPLRAGLAAAERHDNVLAFVFLGIESFGELITIVSASKGNEVTQAKLELGIHRQQRTRKHEYQPMFKHHIVSFRLLARRSEGNHIWVSQCIQQPNSQSVS